jgi:hypothetical protein
MMTMTLLLALFVQAFTVDPKLKPVYLGSDIAGQYQIALVGPQTRLNGLAQEAAQKYLPFNPAEAPADVAANELVVVVVPGAPLYRPYSGWDVTLPVAHVVIKSKSGIVVQPLKVELFPYEWNNAAGGKVTSGGATARFPMELPPGELDVVIVHAHGSYQKTLKAKDRGKVK